MVVGLAERLWAKVDRSGGPDACWPFTGGLAPTGYATIYRDGHTAYAHRVAYELTVGPIPAGLQIDHLCRVRPCVNPSHLEPVTNRENQLRGVNPMVLISKSGRCARGHPFTPENTYFRRDKRSRECLTCRHTRWLRWYRQNRAALPTP